MLLNKTCVAVFFVACGITLPRTGAAQAVPPSGESQSGGVVREVRGQLAMGVNNPALQNTIEVSWTRPLSSSTSPLLEDAHLSAGLVNLLTPALTRVGGWVEYAPLSILSVRAGMEPGGYFGTFHTLLSFESYSDPFDMDTRSERDDSEAGRGMRSYVTPVVQFRAGPIAARVSADFERWRSSASGPYFYEPTRDQLLKVGGDWLLNSTSVAMYEWDLASGGLMSAGLIHNMTRVFDAPENLTQRLGVIAVREFGSRHFGLPRPKLTMTVWHYLDDPSKRNEWGGALLIGFRTGR